MFAQPKPKLQLRHGGTEAYAVSRGGVLVPKRTGIILPFRRPTLPPQPRATRFSPGFIFPPAGALTMTFKGNNAANNVAQSAWGFASSAFGTAAANRYIFVTWYAHNGSALTYNGMTIGGVTATDETPVGTIQQSNGMVGLSFALVPTGTTGTITLNWSGNFTASTANGVGISWYTVYGSLNTTAADSLSDNTTTSPVSKTFAVPAGGIALTSACANNAGATQTGDFTADRAGVQDVAGRIGWRSSVSNTGAAAANKAITFTGFSASSALCPKIGKMYGHT